MFIHPLAGKGLEEARQHPWPDPTRGFDRGGIRELARGLYNDTDKGIIAPAFGSGILEMTLWLQGFDQGYMNLLADKRLTCYLLDRITDIKMAYAEVMLETVGDYCQVFYTGGDDVGHQHSPAMRPELLRELLVPRYKRYHEFIKLKAPRIDRRRRPGLHRRLPSRGLGLALARRGLPPQRAVAAGGSRRGARVPLHPSARRGDRSS